MKRISVIGFGKIGQAIAANILKQAIGITAVDINTELQIIFKKGHLRNQRTGCNMKYSIQLIAKTGWPYQAIIHPVKDCDAIIVAIPLLIDAQKKILDTPFLDTFKKIAPFTRK